MLRIAVTYLSFSGTALSLENGLGRTPPMGWLSWERYGCETDCVSFPNRCISQQLYVDMADKLVELGLADLGYRYVNIDDCWSDLARSASGDLVENKDRFPSGIQWLSDYIHEKGLLFGMYTDIGTLTCGGYPGLAGHVDADVRKFIAWGVDSLKVDGCYANVADMKHLYSELSEKLQAGPKSVLYSCSWPAYEKDHCENESDMTILIEKCNLWRNFDDIQDSFGSVRYITDFFARNSSNIIVRAAGPGHFNDPDMLVVGNPGLSLSEQRAQFALWAVLAAPLYISADLRSISQDSLAILKNEEVIAINQDPLGAQGYVVSDSGPYRVWVRPLSPTFSGEERKAVLFENKAEIFGQIRFHFSVNQLGWNAQNGPQTYSVRDVHRKENVATETKIDQLFVVDVDESSVEFFIFTKHSSVSSTVVIIVE